jgi:hypothetical protein
MRGDREGYARAGVRRPRGVRAASARRLRGACARLRGARAKGAARSLRISFSRNFDS